MVEDYKCKEVAALKIQQTFRAWITRKRYVQILRTIIRLQRWCRKCLNNARKAEERRSKLEKELDDIEFAQKLKYNLSLVEIPEEPSNCYTELDESECKKETTCEENTGSRVLEGLYNIDTEAQTEMLMGDIERMDREAKECRRQRKSLRESLGREIQGLRSENRKLKGDVDRMKAASKENLLRRDRSSNSRQTNKEVAELKMLVSRYEEEVIKLKANLKYTKKALQNRSLPSNESRDEDNWKETCFVLYYYL
eukprot:TRINITY_DN15065_c0_g1_i11.p1 TRINITY_DN15065_c0_g1~~TRINITY_DN15065_c0_g1_i11.p1  ORF type:complete len:253 (-),score=98.35 TRINITY_DN15065_c0_g1_i11:375-1133(-)